MKPTVLEIKYKRKFSYRFWHWVWLRSSKVHRFAGNKMITIFWAEVGKDSKAN